MKNKYTIITQDGLKKLQDELEGLKHEREENIEALKKRELKVTYQKMLIMMLLVNVKLKLLTELNKLKQF